MKKAVLALFVGLALSVAMASAAHAQQWKKVPAALLHGSSGTLFPNGSGEAPLGYIPPPYILYDSSGNVFPTGSGTPLGYIPPAFTCYTLSAGSAIPCNFTSGSGTVTSVTGTANQIDVATGTTAPVISLDPSLILPAGTTGLPVATGISGLGTGVATALEVNVGSAGAPVTNGGALGTPASGVITNLTGTCTACTANSVALTSISVSSLTTTYQVLTTDFINYPYCKLFVVPSGTFTITLVASGTQPALNQCIDIVNYGTGYVTVARSGQNINGGTTSLLLLAGSSSGPTFTRISSDGTNYFAQGTGLLATPFSTNATLADSASTPGSITIGTGLSGQSGDILSQGTGGTVGQVRMFGANGAGGGFATIGVFTTTSATFGGSISPVAARKGTFTCTAAGTITITNSNELVTSDVIISLNTAGGTISTAPAMKTVSTGTGFTVLCGAADTSVYNYDILN